MAYFSKPNVRKLRCEALEARRLLAVVTVDTVDDVIDFNDGKTSLREAIFATNTVPGADEINFDFGFDGPATILLTQGELQITDSLTINGPGAEMLTIDASGNDPTPSEDNSDGTAVFDVLRVRGFQTPRVEISGVRIVGADASFGAINNQGSLSVFETTIADNFSAGIWSDGSLAVRSSVISGNLGSGIYADGELQVFASVIHGNTVVGIEAEGNLSLQSSDVTQNGYGGIRSHGRAEVLNSQISGNTSPMPGGGISHSGDLILKSSTVVGNTSEGGGGGGIFSPHGSVDMNDTVVARNTTNRNGGGILAESQLSISDGEITDNLAGLGGGGIASFDQLQIVTTTVSGNRALGGAGIYSRGAVYVGRSTLLGNVASDSGGGILTVVDFFDEAIISNSTISSNVAQRDGGGIWSDGSTTIEGTTIAGNLVGENHAGVGRGGGIFANEGLLSLHHTIVAGNIAGESNDIAGIINSSYSLIGSGADFLGPLADNGGPTLTHALLPGNPAIDAGDPALRPGGPGVTEFDQRGNPYQRVSGSRLDLGAVELQPIPGDFDADGDADGIDLVQWKADYGQERSGLDFLHWQRTLGDDVAAVPNPAALLDDDAAREGSSLATNAVGAVDLVFGAETLDVNAERHPLRGAVARRNAWVESPSAVVAMFQVAPTMDTTAVAELRDDEGTAIGAETTIDAIEVALDDDFWR